MARYPIGEFAEVIGINETLIEKRPVLKKKQLETEPSEFEKQKKKK